MLVRFWGTRGSIPSPGHRTSLYGGNTSCVEVLTGDGTCIVLDSGSGIRLLGLDMLRRPSPHRVHLLIGHTHWDHIQGFPFFIPAFLPGTDLHIYGSAAFQRSLEDSLSGQMQYSYFPVKLHELASRLHYTELEEGFFRIGNILVETQYLNHTAPTIAYRISADGATIAYVTDHEPFWNPRGPTFHHPGDQRHIEFLRGADLVIHDAQYTSEEYRTKLGWGHSPAEYATDISMAADVSRLALFHHEPTHDDNAIKQIEDAQRLHVATIGSRLDVFAAAEGMEIEVSGKGSEKTINQKSAPTSRPIAGGRVLVVTNHNADLASIGQVLPDDGLVVIPVKDGRSALENAVQIAPDLVILDATLADGDGVNFVQPLRDRLAKPELPTILLTEGSVETSQLYSADGIVTDYLAKPFSPPMLRTRVRAWLTRTMSPLPTVDTIDLRHEDDSDPEAANKESYSAKALVETVASIPLFASLTPDELKHLLACSTEHRFPASHVVIRQDDHGENVYIVLSGRVRVLETLPDTPAEMFLVEMGPGEIFGELGILREGRRSAGVVTVERTRVLSIPAADFLATLQLSHEMSLVLLRVLAGRLYDADRLLAKHAPDTLTGLPGRRAFLEMYRRLSAVANRRGSNVVMLIVDVVHLKEINDRFGYNVGDDVLRTVADALLESSRSTDLISRYGGDEFAALLIEGTVRDAEIILSRVHQKLHAFAVYRGLPLTAECRMAFTVSDNPPENAEDLLRLADEELQAQRSGQPK